MSRFGNEQVRFGNAPITVITNILTNFLGTVMLYSNLVAREKPWDEFSAIRNYL